MNPYLAALLIFSAYLVLVIILKRKGILKKLGLTLWGPILIWRTQSGKRFIDWLARPRRFWRAFAGLSKALCVVVMIFIMGLLIWQTTLVSRIPAEAAPTPEMMLGIPGINPLIPIGYGILGLVVAIVVHEFAHGVLTRVGDMRVRSMGLIFMIFPLGAFVEPEEEELVKTDKRRRMDVYAVGPATNVIVALICALIFSGLFLASVVPLRDNPVVIQVAADGPADHAGIPFGSQIVSVNGYRINSTEDLEKLPAPDPGELVPVEYSHKGEFYTHDVVSGVAVLQTSSGLPAAEAGIKEGMIIASINDTILRNPANFSLAMSKTRPYQTVNLTVLAYFPSNGTYEVSEHITNITLGSKHEYLASVAPAEIEGEDIGFLGVNTAYIGAATSSPEVLIERIAHPISSADSAGELFSSLLYYIALPFAGLAPIQSPISDLYAAEGLLSWMPSGAFWIVANCFYWVFWINLMVGLTNVLPAVPLDGGYLFRDAVDWITARLKKDATEEERQRYVSQITYLLALIVLFLVLWQIIGPRVL